MRLLSNVHQSGMLTQRAGCSPFVAGPLLASPAPTSSKSSLFIKNPVSCEACPHNVTAQLIQLTRNPTQSNVRVVRVKTYEDIG